MTRITPNEHPASGTYIVIDRLTKMQVTGSTFEQLFNNACRMRMAVGAVSGLDLRAEVENWVCQDYPGDCTGVDMAVPRKRHLTLSDVIRGTKVLASLKINGGKLVSREEAERRGEICKTCQFNVRYDKPCVGWCAEIVSMVHDIIGHQGLPVDAYLHACSVCSCVNSAQIWIPLQILENGVTDDMKKQFRAIPNCWKQYPE